MRVEFTSWVVVLVSGSGSGLEKQFGSAKIWRIEVCTCINSIDGKRAGQQDVSLSFSLLYTKKLKRNGGGVLVLPQQI